MRGKKAEKRKSQTDKKYQNRFVAKFINKIMKDGKKTVAEKAVYSAFDILSQKNLNPLEIFEKALQNVGPKIEVKPRRVGGASYQVPTEVRGDRRMSLAVRWVANAARKRSSKEFHTFSEKLAAELLDATNNQGEAIKKRDTVLRMAEANKAFAHFRW
ncbi:MAG: 30S ribosomal protein S7 [Candidatus Levybacteria bacterium RIFCSPHIGHO2_12_FULL_38_12]|nr:MAG: 30S ribosomal protein S7 [Candidatus Levybacteria bacterium RIFCSPHIGHO2_01_FULL_38_12]OGH21978.1 MAG: 30S ribosomal protein S7 [Candidatus Levybacteria bacterium RIFCSPHIGHO2_02_FULL_37_18]OGH23050.1 MAG: 30S ribosomal protein S7 [Candidatus Levybacteria bacterium RIFCSPHIGHO2_12_FULL_38_12]OGH33671.1 MAG: 30S ribosomal protein S7 [Candidatus Levybacteria bacterium RIFCSPLOWO2_01_FULL_37_20]OGH44577.1 MAG: 30S ribosomal protein S7 [Candidatus Levybacteria bacterium RIFCSPLOWO2_02_FULL_